MRLWIYSWLIYAGSDLWQDIWPVELVQTHEIRNNDIVIMASTVAMTSSIPPLHDIIIAGNA